MERKLLKNMFLSLSNFENYRTEILTKKVFKLKFSLLFLGILLLNNVGLTQGIEDFSNIPASSGTYLSRSWAGTNSVTWTATAARTDQTLNGKAICTNGSGTVTSPSYANGMGTLTFSYVRGFTSGSARSLTVWVNGIQQGGTTTVNATSSTVQNYSASLNIAGNVSIEIKTSGAQIIIDDIAWTAFSSCAAPTTQASALTLNTPTASTLSASWATGNGDGNMVVIRPTTQSILDPTSGTSYTADTDYSLAEQINANNRVVFRGAGTSITITGLTPQTNYTGTVYAYASATDCYNVSSPISASHRTLSNSVTVQASGVIATPFSPTVINLSVSAATFPSSGATQGGYIVIYSTGTPTLTSTNGTAPAAGVGTIFSTNASTLPTSPNTSISVTGLTSSTTYNFVVIPYTWDGVNASTYNYLTTSAPTTSATTSGNTAPILSSLTATFVENTMATLSANIVGDGGVPIIASGFVWSETAINANPILGGLGCTNISSSTTFGTFSENITSLPTATNISYVAYATNSLGTTFTPVSDFTTLSPATNLVFGNLPPTTGNVNSNLTAFTVVAKRADNSTDAEFVGTVTLNLLSGTGNFTGNTTNAVAGVATFNLAQFDVAGTITFDASASGLTNSPASANVVITLANTAIRSWVNTGSTLTWYTSSNWSGSVVPSSSEVARWNNSGSAIECGINLGTGLPTVAALEVTSLRTRTLLIGGSGSTSGSMTLNGATINGNTNVVLKNSSDYLFTVNNNQSNSSVMNILLGNSTENIVLIEGAGDIGINAVINGAGKNLTKSGTGTGLLRLFANNTYSGNTKINSGIVQIEANERINNSSKLILNGGIFKSGATIGFTETMGTLSLRTNSAINLGTGNHSLIFSNSASEFWTGNTLTITGWTGNPGFSGSAGKIFVGSDNLGLTASQLSKIVFTGFQGTAMQLSNGEIVPYNYGSTAAMLSGSSTICALTSANLSIGITGGTSPYSVVYSNGSTNTTVSDYVSDSPISVTPTSTTTYSLVSVTDALGYIGVGNSGTAEIIVAPSNVSSTAGTYTATAAQTDGGQSHYISSSCEKLASITDAAGGNALGSTTVSSTLGSSVITGPNGRVYLPRTFTITPTSNGVSTASVYLSQADFTAYNAANNTQADLPSSGSNGDPLALNMRVMQATGGDLTTGTFKYGYGTLTWDAVSSSWAVHLPDTVTNSSTGQTSGIYYFFTNESCGTVVITNPAVSAITQTTATLTWDAVNTLQGWYAVRYRQVGATIWINGSTGVNNKPLSGLLPNTSYEATIRRMCSVVDSSAWSSTVTFMTLALPGCASGDPVLSSTVTTPTFTTAGISWSSVLLGGGWHNIRYRVVGASSWTNITAGNVTSTTIGGLVSGSTYEIQVNATCNLGTPSAWSNLVTFTTAGCSAGAPILSSTVTTPTFTTAGISWSSVLNSGGWHNIRYRVVGAPSWTNITAGNVTSTTIGGLVSGSTYEVQVNATCNLGTPSAWSNLVTFTTAGCSTGAPVLSSTVATPTFTTAGISWSSVLVSGGWHNIRYRAVGATSWTNMTAGNVTSTTIGGLVSGSTYEVQVNAMCNLGTPSAWSNMVTFTTAGCSTGAPVLSSTVATPTFTTAGISWSSVLNSGGWHNIRYRVVGAPSWTNITAGNVTSKTIGGLVSGSTYEVQVNAMCNLGTPSAWSNMVTFTTLSNPSRPMKNEQVTTMTEKDFDLKVYPNPTENNLNLVFETEKSSLEYTIVLMDMTGRVIKQESKVSLIGLNRLEVEMENYIEGVYTLQIYSDRKLLFSTKVRKI